MARPEPKKKVGTSAGIQCSLLTEMAPPCAPRGGARVRSSIDPRKLSNEFLKMDSRKIRMTVVKESTFFEPKQQVLL